MLIVQKYGGTSVGTVERIREVARRCLATHDAGHQVVVIVSAMSGETNRLLALPDPLPDTDRVEPASVDRQAFVRFDTNRYSVPTVHAERTLTLVCDDVTVRVLDGAACVAHHERSYGKRQVIEVAAHRAALVAERRAARDLKGRDRLRAVAPDFGALLERWTLGGPSLAIQVTRAIKLLDLYGDEVFAAAVAEIVARGLRDTGALAVACDRLGKERRRPVPTRHPDARARRRQRRRAPRPGDLR